MPEGDAVEKFLEEQKTLETRKQALIDAVLQERATALQVFDDKLAKLGYKDNNGARSRKSHHKKTTVETVPAAAKEKPKATAEKASVPPKEKPKA